MSSQSRLSRIKCKKLYLRRFLSIKISAKIAYILVLDDSTIIHGHFLPTRIKFQRFSQRNHDHTNLVRSEQILFMVTHVTAKFTVATTECTTPRGFPVNTECTQTTHFHIVALLNTYRVLRHRYLNLLYRGKPRFSIKFRNQKPSNPGPHIRIPNKGQIQKFTFTFFSEIQI